MSQDRKKIKKEKKRLKFIREMRNRRRESKRKFNINDPGFKVIPKSKNKNTGRSADPSWQ